jgi:hypothetical protein
VIYLLTDTIRLWPGEFSVQQVVFPSETVDHPRCSHVICYDGSPGSFRVNTTKMDVIYAVQRFPDVINGSGDLQECTGILTEQGKAMLQDTATR